MNPDVAIAVLAAGQSRRFGNNKLLRQWQGLPLLQHALSAAQQASPGRVCLVTGHDDRHVLTAAGKLADRIVHNPRFREGMGTSIAAAAEAVGQSVSGLIVALGDQPQISAEHLQCLIEHWDGQASRIVVTTYAGVQGAPVLFGSNWFASLRKCRGDEGARHILRENSTSVVQVAFEPAAIDIDTPADFAALDNS